MILVGNDIVVVNEAGERLRANITSDRWPLVPGVGPDFQGAVQGAPGDTGWAFWNAEHGGMRITVACEGYETREIVTDAPAQVRVTMKRSTPPPSNLGTLTIDGKFFWQGGKRTTLVESSDFSLFMRYLDGDDITPILRQRQGLGFNCLRVWLLNQSVVGYRNAPAIIDAGIDPRAHADFYARLRAFCGVLGAYGQNVDLTVFTQTKTLMPSRSDQQAHLTATGDAVRGLGNVIVSLVNEWDQHDNACFEDLERPAGVIYSAGSNGSDAVPPVGGQCCEYHIIGSEWQRKTGHNAFEYAEERGIPCWTSEAQRAPDNDSNAAHFEDAAAAGALLCGGTCGHSVGGKFSRLFVGPELDCMAAHCRGAKSVPLEFQAGRYIHRDDLETPGIIRVYERRLDDGRGHIVSIRA